MNDYSYRDAIYPSYRSNIYDRANPAETIAGRDGSYLLDFEDLLPAKDAEILDLGCGSGFLLWALKRAGYERITGLDASCEQIEYARASGLKVEHGEACPYLANRAESFDAILMSDVLEHIGKDELFPLLRSIRSALKPGGKFIARTINASSIYGGTSRYVDLTHEISFTESSLRQILIASGFNCEVVRDNRIPFGLAPKRFARWLAIKLLRGIQRFVFTVEVGVNRPKYFGKLLVVMATRQ